MRSLRLIFTGLIFLSTAALLPAQVAPGGVAPTRPPVVPAEPPPQPPAQPQPVAPPPNAPATPAAAAPAPGQAPATAPQTAAVGQPNPNQPRLADNGGFLIPSASLTEMIDILARRLKINYILDPRVKGTVTIYTYGEVKPVDEMQILQTILRVNGATMVKVGDLYRIVPINLVPQLPVDPITTTDPKTLPDDERMILNLIFLKYATATELDKLIVPFLGEGGKSTPYEPANLLIVQDNARSMRRTMELVAVFDSDTFAGQRVRLFETQHSRPSDLVKDLDNVFKAYALSEKGGAVRFIPIDHINTVISVAPNPGIFVQVEDWIKKLDIAPKIPAGAVTNYVYRLKYGNATTVAAAIMALYTGNVGALITMANAANSSMINSGLGYPGAMSGGGYGGINGGYNQNYGYNPNYASPYGNANQQYGASPFGANYGQGAGVLPAATNPATVAAAAAPGTTVPGQNLTGTYLGNAPIGAQVQAGIPHIVPNPFDNTLIIQCTPQEYEQILDLLRQIDIPPRQVLIEAKIYEVDLTADLAGGVEAYLQKVGSAAATSAINPLPGTPAPSRILAAVSSAGGLGLTTGALVLKSHELLAQLSASDSKLKGRVISSPSIIATDSIPATMNIGAQVPTLTSQAIAGGVQSGGNSVFTNTISNQTTGTTFSILAHVNSSGIVTMVINQQVSAIIPPPAGVTVQSPSFSNRSMSTQMTVRDGDTVAIGGIITENHTESSSGVPFLHRIPVVGAAFGAKDVHTDRTELIIFLTPRVIYDTVQLDDATEEIKSSLKRVSKLMKDQ
jgi:general secretion pathway protein D